MIEDWNLNFYLGNLAKAAWYLEREMQCRRCMTEDEAERAGAAGNL